MSKRAKRRKEEARVFKKRFDQEMMYRRNFFSDLDREHNIKCAMRHARKRTNCGTLCSCTMCMSPRYLYGNSEQARTRQELRSALTLREQLEE